MKIRSYADRSQEIKIQIGALCLMFCILHLVYISEAQFSDGMLDIKDAIAIVSAAMGVKIIIEGDIKGKIPLELDNQSPRQIRDKLERVLRESGYSWVSEGGIVYITKTGRRPRVSMFGSQLPLSYYIEVIEKNNLFRPLGGRMPEVKSELVLTGMFSIGENRRAIIEDIAGNKSYYVSSGESVGSYKVVEITEDQVILTGPGGQVTLKLPVVK